MIEAGADVIIGTSSRHPKPAYFKGHLIVYSLGNFLFNGSHDENTDWLGIAAHSGPKGDGRVGHDYGSAR